MIFLFSLACSSPFTDYWPDETAHPSITTIEPTSISGMLGGQTITIQGTQLSSTKTVVIGDRNAEILSATDSTVEVVVPANTAGAGAVEVVLVTEGGMARATEGLTYSSLGNDWWAMENASVIAGRLDCPVEAWALAPGEEWTSLLWCGFEMGYSWGNAVVGKENQAGFAGDLSGFHPLSALPPTGESFYWGIDDEGPLRLPNRYSPFLASDSISLHAPRNFEDDLTFIDHRIDQLELYYNWWNDVVSLYPTVAFYDDDSCWLGEASLETVSPTSLIVDAGASGATGLLLGYGIEEDYDGEAYYSEGFTSSATISIDGNTVESEQTGLDISYDDYSGQFFANGVNNLVGVADLPFSSSLKISTSFIGQATELGRVDSMAELEIIEPDLLSGLTQIDQASRFDISWNPILESPSPAIVVAEIRIYDFSVNNPNGWHEVSRLVRSADPTDGELSFIPLDLLQLPITENKLDDEYNLVGLWGEITVSHHQLRKVANGDGEMVIDFVHAVQTPIDVINSNAE
jgi:hypothetical protein